MSKTDLISVKELAGNLDVSDSLVKKYIRDFEIPVERIKNRIHLNNESIEILKDIVRLRASGKKNKDIKVLFDEAKKAQQTAGRDDQAEAEPKKAEKSESTEDKETKKVKKTTKKAKAEADSETSSDEAKLEKAEKKAKESKAKKTTDKKSEKKNLKKKKTDSSSENKKLKEKDLDSSEAEDDEDDFSSYLNEQVDNPEIANEIEKALDEIPEDDEYLDDDDILIDEVDGDEEEEIEETTSNKREAWRGKAMSPRRIKRRAFNFRYIQRQIANDTRKINHIKHKLKTKRSRLSNLEVIDLEDDLERKCKMLNSWLQLLRWVKS